MRKTLTIALTLGSVLLISNANATVIGFEDMTSRANFTSSSLGNVASSYNGYKWGYSANTSSGGWGTAVYPTSVGNPGWASATTGAPAFNSPNNMAAGAGSTYAWNQTSAKSLWIDFQGLVDFNSGMFAAGKKSDPVANSPLLTFRGYNAGGTIIATDTFAPNLTTYAWGTKTFGTAFDSIRYLEIVATANSGSGTVSANKFFSVDNLDISSASASVPDAGSSMMLMGFGLSGLLAFGRKMRL